MATKVIMPKQGLQMEEGTILQWFNKEGDTIKEGDPLFEIETDKLTIEIDAPGSGKLLKIINHEGDVVPITEIIGVIGEDGEDISDLTGRQTGSASKDVEKIVSVETESKAQYELAVIGGGPGGYVAAIRAGQYGIKTVLIEERDLGGTCLNRGCVPTKAMLHSCEVIDNIKTAGMFGIKTGAPEVDMEVLYKNKDKVVNQLKSGVGSLLKANGVEVIRARASFTGEKELLCTSGDNTSSITAENIIIASGSAPSVPPIEGLNEIKYWTSDTLLENNPELPDSLTIIGGGVIGVECATILNDLGVKVIILEMQPQLLPNMDKDIASELKKHLTKAGIVIRTGVKVEKVSKTEKGVDVTISSGDASEIVSSHELMVAVGRRSCLEGLNIETINIKQNRGIIAVNSHMQTNVSSIYAIGDIIGGWQLAHAASAEGLIAVDHIAGKENNTNMDVMSSCVYTRPEISSVGLSEAAASAAGYQVKCGIFSFAGNSKAVLSGESKGFVKIVSDEKTGAVLGGQIIGPRATELITEIALAISTELTIEEIGDLIHPHPTISEAIVESVHDIEELSIHKIPARK